MDRDELRALQLERLRVTLARAYQSIPFYRSRLDDAGFAPGDLKSLDDLRSALLVRPKVKLVEPCTLERTEGKAKRVVDNRPKWI